VSGLHKDVIKYGKKWDCLLQKAGLATAESWCSRLTGTDKTIM
jgi:hypothetical protein